MKGLLNFKPIQESIVFHATPNEFGQFLVMSRSAIKFTNVIDILKRDFRTVGKYEWGTLEYVKYQTDQICIEAVRKNGMNLQFVNQQTDQICLEAVRKYGHALRFVKHQTDQICFEAVSQSSTAEMFIDQ